MKLTPEGIELIKEHESLRLRAYLCPGEVWTIGYGNTYYRDGKQVRKGDVISRQEAEELFDYVVNEFATEVKELIQVPLTDNQFSALVSFSYNIGIGAFSNSTLLKKLNAGNNYAAGKEFRRWVYDKGEVLPGLVKRRKEEEALFFSYTPLKVPDCLPD
ncbi:lysozyme [Nafulsella turpanensis]|uniref:lysozyme n=1 Tax=Nafulsella turpanensis TaxID=1265690 RepID=UPI000347839D|nr:lysozyme [Nafulsella turpanensis]